MASRNRSFGAVDFKPPRSAAQAGAVIKVRRAPRGISAHKPRSRDPAGRTGDLLAWWSKPDISGDVRIRNGTIQSHLDDGASEACREAPAKVTGGGRDFVQEACRFGSVIGDGHFHLLP